MILTLKYLLKTIFTYAIFAWISVAEASTGLTAPQIKAAGGILRIDAPGDILAPLSGTGNLCKIGTGRLSGNPDTHTGRISVLEGIYNINNVYPGPTSLSLNAPLAIGFTPTSAAQLEATSIALSKFNALQLVPYDPSGLDGIINIAIGSYRYPIIAADASSIQSTTIIVPDIPNITFKIQPSITNSQWIDVVIDTTANVTINTSTVIFKTIYLEISRVDVVKLKLEAANASTDMANAIIDSVGSASKTSTSGLRYASELRTRLQALDKLPTKQKFEAMLEAIAKETPEPIVFTSSDEQIRSWIMPYATYGRGDRSQFSQGNHRRTAGSLIGIEHRNLKEGWGIGAFSGIVYTHENVLGDHLSWDHAKGYNVGIYGVYKPAECIRFESMLFATSLKHKKQRHDTNDLVGEFLALSNYNQFDVVSDTNVRFTHNVDECWSVSTNLGYTYFNSKNEKYSEYNVSMVGINQPSVLSVSGEVYTGIGVRYNHKDEECNYGTILTYEIGKEAKKHSNSTTGSTQNGLFFAINPTIRKRTTRYLSIFSYFEGSDKIKYILKYSNISAAHDLTHNLMFKVEWKF
jgi:hypothetical protein